MIILYLPKRDPGGRKPLFFHKRSGRKQASRLKRSLVLEPKSPMLVHASCVSLKGKGILIRGASGSGKSDLALRLIDRGADLVADDQTLLKADEQNLIASAPASIAGLIEIRHIGLLKLPYVTSIPVALLVDVTALDEPIERMPERRPVFFLDRPIQQLRLPAFAASTPAKISLFLAYAEAS